MAGRTGRVTKNINRPRRFVFASMLVPIGAQFTIRHTSSH